MGDVEVLAEVKLGNLSYTYAAPLEWNLQPADMVACPANRVMAEGTWGLVHRVLYGTDAIARRKQLAAKGVEIRSLLRPIRDRWEMELFLAQRLAHPTTRVV